MARKVVKIVLTSAGEGQSATVNPLCVWADSRMFNRCVRPAEAVAAASECTEGSLHLWPEVGHVELLDDEGAAPVAVGTPGRLICTGLINRDMPLIRFAVSAGLRPLHSGVSGH